MFYLEIEFKPSLESPETLGIDWLFEHTESESESSDIKGRFIHLVFVLKFISLNILLNHNFNMLRKVKKMEKNRSIPWHFTLSDDDYTTTSEENNSSECTSTHKEFLICLLIIVTNSLTPIFLFANCILYFYYQF